MRANVRTVPLTAPADLCEVPCFKRELVERLRGEMPEDETLESVRVQFTALADRNRLKILYALRDGQELCVCDVAHVLGMSVSSASHHLRKLRDLRILKYRNDGRMAYYSLNSSSVIALLTRALRDAA